jgi:soluble lytic murein transglycosylase-like protein
VALLAAVGLVAAVGAIAFKTTDVTGVARAASVKATARHTVRPTPACPFARGLLPMFERAAADAHLSPAMLYAVAKIESNLREDAHSSAGARGLLQLMPATAGSLDLNAGERSSNVLAGAHYLRELLDRFDSADLALAAYNAGPTAVARAGGAPSIDVVRYVANVNAEWRSVAGCR